MSTSDNILNFSTVATMFELCHFDCIVTHSLGGFAARCALDITQLCCTVQCTYPNSLGPINPWTLFLTMVKGRLDNPEGNQCAHVHFLVARQRSIFEVVGLRWSLVSNMLTWHCEHRNAFPSRRVHSPIRMGSSTTSQTHTDVCWSSLDAIPTHILFIVFCQ